MAATESTRRDSATARQGSQSRFPRALLWIFLAAALFRILTLVNDRGRTDRGAGLVQWRPAESVPAAARGEGKPVLYDFTAAWCPPCHRLDAEGWTDPRIAGIVNRFYLPARIIDRQREEGKNAAGIDQLQRRYAVNVFPTLIVASADGKEIGRFEGYRGRDFLARFLEETRAKANSVGTPARP